MKQNEFACDILLNALKQSASNPFEKLVSYSISYNYNRHQYDEYIRKIQEESKIIEGILGYGYCYNELNRHIAMKNEYISKAQKHYSSANDDIKNANEIYNELKKYN